MRAYCSLVLVANYLQCLAIQGLKGDGWGERERREQRERGIGCGIGCGCSSCCSGCCWLVLVGCKWL